MMTETTLLDPLARRIPLAGPVNFRDLGGYRGLEGRPVRWRQVFRADALDSMTAEDVDVVVEQLDVRMVLDLRSEREIELSGLGPVADAGISWHNVSILDETSPLWQRASEQGDIVEQYLAMLDSSTGKFVEAVSLVADRGGPMVFHCAAGKDRTGLIAAFVLSMLGVPDEDICADYALTAEVLPVLSARYEARADDPRYRAHYEAQPGWQERAKRSMTADGTTIGRVMAELAGRSGSVEGWLVDVGLPREAADALRAQLLA